MDAQLSRPLRLADQLHRDGRPTSAARYDSAVVLAALDPGLAKLPGPRFEFLCLVDQISRFIGTIAIDAPVDVANAAIERDVEVHGDACVVRLAHAQDPHVATVTVRIGTHAEHPGEIVALGDGWLARITSLIGSFPLPRDGGIGPGSLLAASLAAAEVFLRLYGDLEPRGFEMSTVTGDVAPIGELPPEPAPLANVPPLDALLIGCGNVGNGWAAAIRCSGISGHLRAVDRQTLGLENLGPYQLARHDRIGSPKTTLIEECLAPRIGTSRHDEELALFLPRVTRWRTVTLPPIVVNGLDNPESRRDVQRLWPDTLIDMAAQSTTCQVVVHRRGGGGLCLLGAFPPEKAVNSYEQRILATTGLRPERFLNHYTTLITADDVTAAPAEHRAALDAARQSGQTLCGYINARSLADRSSDTCFAASAPFIGGITGARAAALTLRTLAGSPPQSGLHWQYDIVSAQSRTAYMSCNTACECGRPRRVA
jgi:hypothetical protein